MKLKEFNELYLTTEKQLKEGRDKAQELFESGEREYSKYDEYERFLEYHSKYESLRVDISEIIDIISEFKEIHKQFKSDYIAVSTIDEEYDIDSWGDGEYEFNDYGLRFSYYKVIPAVPEDMIKSTFRELIRLRLKPTTENYAQYIDCKILSLFKSGAIDWTTLQKLVYTNCAL